MSKRIGIFGTSGFARETADIAYDQGLSPVYIAQDICDLELNANIGEIILETDLYKYRDMTYTIGIGENSVRKKLASKYMSSLKFVNLIHSSATFGLGQRERLVDRQGLIICAGSRFTNNICIGNFSIFNLNCTVGHDTIIEDYVNIAPGACISGNVQIKNLSWIGTGASINQGETDEKLCIGPNTVIGSGSVVVKTCEPDAVYVGIPAKRIK